ncbi:hypothetical protein FALBO_14539 [Fusarium albosuccineum]|uniref:Zn(2)-C6 fungal-type domain-containing protein n=1 Tax=Fusarium albosuccineum TaxID=1237068 RepID=A0A8H4P786_9HYPO|nr:hypothetical protein FALBO_14539 [Fusarium albosuccineum]
MAPDSAVKRRACAACTSAKLKCTPRASGQCERCARLDKHCEYLNLPERRRKPRVAGRVEALESKIDDLMSQLAHLTQKNDAQISTATSATMSTGGEAELVSSAADDQLSDTLAEDIQADVGREPELAKPCYRDLIDLREADVLVRDFTSNWVQQFPFIYIDPQQTALDIHGHSPFLCLCILGVTIDFLSPRRKRICDEIMNQVTSRIIRNAERNLDLLQGLLVYTAWYRYPVHGAKREIIMMSQLCATLVYDLDLDKKEVLTLEEMRTLIGAFWVSSGIRLMMNKPIGLGHSKQIDKCVRDLESAATHPTDTWARYLTRLRSFITQADDIYKGNKESYKTPGAEALTRIMTTMFDRELEDLKASIPKDLERYSGPAEMESAERFARKFCLVENLWTAEQHPINLEAATVRRTTMLWQVLKLSRSVIERFLSTPDAEVRRTTFVILSHLCGALETLASAVWGLVDIVLKGDRNQAANHQAALQSIISEASYLKLVADLRRKLEVATKGIPAEDKDIEIFSMLRIRAKLYARCYHHHIKPVTGIDEWAVSEFITTVPGNHDVWDGSIDLRAEMVDLAMVQDEMSWDGFWWNDVLNGLRRDSGA